jgi:Na+/H+ antiporter NhaD/arsenite permease-like protein
MGSVVLAIAADNRPFVSLAFINIVVAANAGGAFSPFGDITTLMVWQSKQVNFWEFFKLFFPSLINFILPAAIMTLALPKGQPQHDSETITMKTGARRVGLLFLLTIFTAVSLEQLLHLPPFLGMMTGLSYLMFFAFYLRREEKIHMPNAPAFNIFSKVAQAEWDTLLFFFGVIFCVGGLATLGYLTALSHVMYGDLGATTANILIGILSAVIDNIPIMVAVLNMEPDMNLFQWLLVTLTVGVGGSLLSIGSAAGVALMGQSKGHYTFFSHLRWSWAIAIGYAASIGLHLLMNQ